MSTNCLTNLTIPKILAPNAVIDKTPAVIASITFITPDTSLCNLGKINSLALTTNVKMFL